MSDTKNNSPLHAYLSSLLRHGWEESWIPELEPEQIAMIAALANNELAVAMLRAREKD